MSASGSRLWLLLVLLVTAAAYAPSLDNRFTHDDNVVARPHHPDGTMNTMVAELRPLGDYFGANYWEGYRGRQSHLYRPVTVISYAVTNELAGRGAIRPFPHHLLNVLLHLGAVVLVFRLVLLLTAPGGSQTPALLAAAVFGLHAIHSEVVAGIVGRAELFAFVFGAAGLLLHVRAASTRGGFGQLVLLAASAIATLAALLSKESAVAWAAFTPLFAVLRDPEPRALARQLGAMVVTVVLPVTIYLALRSWALAEMPEQDYVNYLSNPLYFADPTTRILTGTVIWGYGLYLTALPFDLVSDYGPNTFALVHDLWDPAFLGAAVALVGALVVGLALIRRQPMIFLAVACFLGFGFLTSNLPLAIGTNFGERLYYTPSLAVALVVAWLWPRAGRGLLGVTLAVWLIANATVIVQRNAAWHDDRARILHDVEVNPDSIRLLDAAAEYQRKSGDVARAEELWQRALEIEPGHVGSRVNYGAELGRQERYDEAETMLKAALDPPEQLRLGVETAHVNLALIYEATARPGRAWKQMRAAFAINPTMDGLHAPLLRLAKTRLDAGVRDGTVAILEAIVDNQAQPPGVRRRAHTLLQ